MKIHHFEKILMQIEIEFYASFRAYSPSGEKKITLRLQEGATLEKLWAELGIPEKVERICLVNGTYCSQLKVLKEGDVVSLLPMIDGG